MSRRVPVLVWICGLALAGVATVVAPVSTAPVDAATPTIAAPVIEAEHVAGQVVVRFADSMSDTAKDSALSIARVEGVPVARAGDAVVLQTEPGQSVESAIAALRTRAAVRYAEPNYLWHTSTVPNDVRLVDQWSLHNTGSPGADIDASEAWNLTTGSDSVVVAIVDSGVAYDHPDLAANMWTNPGESGGGRETNHVDDDNNGYVDDFRGWDVVGASRASASDSDNDPRDILGHGTHVAGTIGAVGDNGIGVAGVAWHVRLMPVRVFDGEGVATSADIAEGFSYAANMGARIVNYSGGGATFSQAVQDAISSHPNTLYVVAAGNEMRDLDANGNNTYPCELPQANIVCVAATTQNDTLASFSNYSENSVDLAAPGVNILSTYPAFGPTLLNETFETDPFGGGSPRWNTGAAPGSANTWAVTAQYSPGTGSSVTDSPPQFTPYANSNDSWIQTNTAVNLTGQKGCRLQYPLVVDAETGSDFFYVSGRADAAITSSDLLRAWWGYGGVNDVIDISQFDGGPLYLRFGLDSDASSLPPPVGVLDGAYVDNIRVNCVSTSYSGGGASELTYLSGTSMATPHVAGVAALVLARAPSLTTAALRSALVDTGDVLPSLAATAGKTSSGRRLDAFAAVSAAGSAPPPPVDGGFHALLPSRVVDTRAPSVGAVV
ncbi:MAG: S8 family serine peptidase, partial [Acidimicrobiales bacterium]